MNAPRFTHVKSYTNSLAPVLTRSALVMGFFTLIYLFIGLEYVGPGMIIAGIIALICFIPEYFKIQKRFRLTQADLRSGSSEAEAAADFPNAQEVSGMGKVGEKFFFGHGNGVIVPLQEVRSIILDVEYIYDDSAIHNRRKVVTLQFQLDGRGRRQLCSLHNRNQYKRAAAVLTLIGDKCPMTEEVIALRDQYQSKG